MPPAPGASTSLVSKPAARASSPIIRRGHVTTPSAIHAKLMAPYEAQAKASALVDHRKLTTPSEIRSRLAIEQTRTRQLAQDRSRHRSDSQDSEGEPSDISQFTARLSQRRPPAASPLLPSGPMAPLNAHTGPGPHRNSTAGPSRHGQQPYPSASMSNPVMGSPSASSSSQSARARISRELGATSALQNANLKLKVTQAAWNACQELQPFCPPCILVSAQHSPRHMPGKDCFSSTMDPFFRTFGTYWIDMKRSMQPPFSSQPQFCSGCSMPCGTPWVHGEILGSQCQMKDTIALVCWTLFRHEDKLQNLKQTFFPYEDIPDWATFARWLRTPHPVFFTNYMRIFLYYCNQMGFTYCNVTEGLW